MEAVNNSDAASQDAASAAVSAHDYGRKLYMMLEASSFSAEEKAAWMALLPELSLEQIERLSGLLEKNLMTQIADEFEDVLLKIKAARAKHELSRSALDLQTEQELAAIERELSQE